jgi:hypothetical protein
MKIEQNRFTFGLEANDKGYLDLARALSALNGKSITQTKRSDGKYKPLGYMVRLRSLVGTVGIETLNCGYPTRNSVVLAGAARDAMLKSAGVSRSNLESYQKELRIKFDADQTDASSISPGATALGFGSDYKLLASHANAWGNFSGPYDYTKLVYDDPASPGTDKVDTMCMLGNSATGITHPGNMAVVYNWSAWRHSFTPSSADDDIQDNIFSYVMQQSSTSDEIIDIVADDADNKPYTLGNFISRTINSISSTDVGNPTSPVICAPLGLLKFTAGTSAAHIVEVEILGVTEL